MTEVYALRYAYRTASQRGEHFSGHDVRALDEYPIDYYVWAICRDDDVVLVDTGFTRETAERRGSRHYLARPAELLRIIGRSPSDVSTLVLSHLHYDHTGTVSDFPNATVQLQRRELEFWMGPLAARGAFGHFADPGDVASVAALAEDGRLRLLDGDAEVAPGLSVHLLGGHTPGMQVVRVETEHGVVVLAADASHFYENVEGDAPYGIVHDMPAMYTAFDRLHELAGPDGVIVPGHDPLVRERHATLPGAEDRVVVLAGSPSSARVHETSEPKGTA